MKEGGAALKTRKVHAHRGEQDSKTNECGPWPQKRLLKITEVGYFLKKGDGS